jgi:hypothetical protein
VEVDATEDTLLLHFHTGRTQALLLDGFITLLIGACPTHSKSVTITLLGNMNPVEILNQPLSVKPLALLDIQDNIRVIGGLVN